MTSLFTHDSDSILMNGLPIYIYCGIDNKEYLLSDKIQIVPTDCGYRIDVVTEPDIAVTLVFPCLNRYIYIGNNYNHCNPDIVSFYHYNQNSTKLLDAFCKSSDSPIVHLSGDPVLSFSVYGECKISCFKAHYEQYCSIQGISSGNIMQFYVDIASNTKVNQQRHKLKQKEYIYYNILDESEIMNILYNGFSIKKSIPDHSIIMEEIHKINEILISNGLYPIFSGSIAKTLNGIDCNIRDIDIIFKNYSNIQKATEILINLGYVKQQENEYFTRMIKDGGLSLDIAYDNYNILLNNWNIDYESKITYININGLLWMSLLNLQEFDRTKYRDTCTTNDRSLFELTMMAHKKSCYSYNDKIIKNILKYSDYTNECQKFSDQLVGYEMFYVDTRVNDPFRINVFGNGIEIIYSIINVGSPTECRIVSNYKPVQAIWHGINGFEKEVKIELYDYFSIMIINEPIQHGYIKVKL